MNRQSGSSPRADAYADLRRALRLEPLSDSSFVGTPLPTSSGVPFGGLLVAQALSAATETTPPTMLPRSVHAYFIGTGHSDLPVEIDVEHVRDGRSSAWRCVNVRQGDQLILRAEATFSVSREGPQHQDAMPAVTRPEDLADVGMDLGPYDDVYKFWGSESAFDLRYVTPAPRVAATTSSTDPHSQVWVRAGGPAPEDPRQAALLIAYASDMCMLDACIRPHGLWFGDGSANGLSLDHSIWFHTEARVDDWLLMDLRSPAMSGGRGLGIANIFSRDGQLICSVAQQGSIRAL